MMLGNTRPFLVSRNLLETAAKMQALVTSPVSGVPPHGSQTEGKALNAGIQPDICFFISDRQ